MLNPLPLVIIYEICFLLDIRSVFNFRHVNRRAQQIVRVVRGYEAMITHAIGSLRVILKTNIASWLTLSDLFKMLCTRDCYLCGSFVGFIFLPTFMRCCVSCIQESSLPSVLPLSIVNNPPGKPNLGWLYLLVPSVKSLPGIYSMDKIVRKRRTQMMSTEFVRNLFLRDGDWRTRVTQTNETALLHYMVTTSLPYLDIESGGIQKDMVQCLSNCSGKGFKVIKYSI
ncbi:hypothetical protein BJX99DRAFT_231499 [Aspergillus californicus]